MKKRHVILAIALLSVCSCTSQSGLYRGARYLIVGPPAPEEAGFRALYDELEADRTELRMKIEFGMITKKDGTIDQSAANLRNIDLQNFDTKTDELLDTLRALAQSTTGVDMSDKPGESRRLAKQHQQELLDVIKKAGKDELDKVRNE